MSTDDKHCTDEAPCFRCVRCAIRMCNAFASDPGVKEHFATPVIPEAEATINICTPRVATLPDGSRVTLPAGTVLTDMTPVAANAKIEIAKQQYAVPAQEHTKQEVEITKRTKQLTVQHVVVGGVVSLCAVLAFLNSNSGAYLAAMAAVMGGVYGVSLYVNKTTPKLPPKEDDTK